MLGKVNTNHIAVNNYSVNVIGLFGFYATTVSGVEQEVVTVEMPDRTVVSAGIKKATEITLTVPMHHIEEQVALETWFQSTQDPVQADYKKSIVLQHMHAWAGDDPKVSYGNKQYTLSGAFPTKRKLPDLDFADDGEMAVVEWTFSVDMVMPT